MWNSTNDNNIKKEDVKDCGSSSDSANSTSGKVSEENQLGDKSQYSGDSGFISGPQLGSPNDDADESHVQYKESHPSTKDASATTQQLSQAAVTEQTYALDSGCIDEEIDDNFDDEELKRTHQERAPDNSAKLQKAHQQISESSKTDGEEMIFDKGVDSGIAEWFCKITLNDGPQEQNSMNNLGAGASDTSSTTAAPITPSHAWKQLYQQDENGNTALHSACYYGYVDDIAVLIRIAPHPSLFNIKNDAAQTGLHLAVLAGQPKILRMLLIAGADSCARDRRGNTALHLACNSGDLQCVKALTIPVSAREINEAHHLYEHRTSSHLSSASLPTDLEIVNYDGESCVHIAAYKGHIEVLRHLVKYGVNINAREWLAGRTPLHIAIECRNEILANYLLEHCTKLNLETKTYGGFTAYQFACTRKNSKLQNDLEKHGAEPLSPPDSDYGSSDSESDVDEIHDPGYFVRIFA